MRIGKIKGLKVGGVLFPGILLILLGIEEWLKKDPVLIENLYSKGLYPFIITGLSRVSSIFPFSLFEALICGVVLFVALGLGTLVWRRSLGGKVKICWTSGLLRLISLILFFAVLFNLLWGFNYYRLSLGDQLGVKVNKHSSAELSSLCESLIRDANTLSAAVERDSQGVMVHKNNAENILRRTPSGFIVASENLGLFKGQYGIPKQVWNSTAMSYAGIAGIYFPFTGEANVNGLVTAAFLPATAMHEMAHVYGYSREDEANFIAWLTCHYHPDADFKYSGAVLGLVYGMSALYDADPEEYQRLKAHYGPAIKADLEANRDFWKRYEGPAEKIQDKMNDRYLKANGQKDGVASYGRMVDLLLEVYSGNLKVWQD